MNLGIIGLGLSFVLSAQNPEPMGLNEAIAIAEKNAFSIQLAQSNVAKSRDLVGEAKGATGLKLNAGTTYTRFDKELTANFGQSTVTTRPIDQLESSLSASVVFDLAGTFRALLVAARLSLKADLFTLESEKTALRYQVRQAYFQVLQAEESEQIFKDALELAKARVTLIERQLKEGVVPKVDLVRARTQVKQAETDLIAAQNRTKLAYSLFNNTLALPVETPVQLKKVEDPMLQVFDFETMVKVAHENRFELMALNEQQGVLSNVTKAQTAGMKPSLSASIQYTHNWDAQGFSSSSNSTVGVLSVNVPILDGGITKARTKAAKRDEEQLMIRTMQTRQFIALETKQALVNLSDAEARVKTSEKRVELATENYRLAKLRAEEGEGINLEVIDAQNELTAARVSLLTAQYDVRIAFAQLQRAVGTDAWPTEGK